MWFSSWLRRLKARFSLPPVHRSRRSPRRERRRIVLSLEQLETRLTPATLTVNTTADAVNPTDGTLSLRDAITAINAGNANGLTQGEQAQVSGTFGNNDTIQFANSLTGQTITLNGSALPTITENLTSDGLGASNLAISGNSKSGIFDIASGVQVSIAGLTIEDGSSSGYGGGIYNEGTLTVSNSTLANNKAAYGGGIFDEVRSMLTVIDSTLANNSATYEGGGIYINNNGTLTATNSTLAGNAAAYGGGIFNGQAGTATLNNTIVAENTSGGDLFPNPDNGSTFSGSNDLIGDGSDLSSFSNSLKGNPLLAPLGNYGGPTETTALLPGSPAIDAGSNALAVDANGNPLTTDERGQPRIVGSAVDIGAFESQGFTIAVANGSNQSTAVNTSFAQPLTVTLTANNSVEPLNGGVVTFTPPTSGASATLSANNAVIGGGSVSVTATANGSSGSYTVTATVAGGSTPASFTLANNLGPEHFVVTDTGDFSQSNAGSDNPTDTNGGVSLRSAIAAANVDAANGISDTVTFSPNLNGDTLNLTQGQLELTAGRGSISIVGGNQITVSGSNDSQVFAVNSGATASIAGLTIEDGYSKSEGGGIDNSGTLTLSNCILADNSALNGGGISNNGTLAVSDSTLTGNAATTTAQLSTDGGGIYNLGALTMTNSTVTDNSANFGGGIYNLGTLVLSGSTVSGNNGTFGGGIDNDLKMLTVINSTIASNSAVGGGGIENSGKLSVTNSTLADNSAHAGGGGIDNLGGAATLNNTIVADSTSGGDLSLSSDQGSTFTGSNDLIGDGSDLSSFSNSLKGNPLLAPLGNYGGPTETMALSSGSPAINAGGPITTVAAGITDTTSTTIGVIYADMADIPDGDLIRVDNELMLVTNVAGNTLTVVRGYDGTTPSTHAAGASVYLAEDQRGVPRAFPADIGADQTQLSLSSLSAPRWIIGRPYSGIIAVSGGNGIYSNLSVTGLPPGLSAQLSGSSIIISGTPTQSGQFSSISVSVLDSAGDTTSGTYSLKINVPMSLSSLSVTQWTANRAPVTRPISRPVEAPAAIPAW